MNLASKARQVLSLAGALAAVVSCQREQRSVTDPSPTAGPLTQVTSSSSTDISPTADTYLNIDALNHSTETTLNLYTWQDFQVANATLMKFSLASIPPGSVISSATLNLYLTSSDATTDATYTVTVHKVINKNPNLAAANGYQYDGVNDWTHNTCCQNGAFLAQSDIGPAVDTKSVDKTVGFKQWNVTSIVQDWFSNPALNFGLLVNSDATKLADRWRFFSSGESSVTGQRPYLTVVYTTGGAGPWPNEPAGFQPFNDQPWTCASPLTYGQLCNEWNYLQRSGTRGADITTDASAPFSPSNVLRIIFPTDMAPNAEPGVNWIVLPATREIYTAWWIKLSPNWTASPAGAGKITFLRDDGGAQVYTGYYHQGGDPINGWVPGPPYRIGLNPQWAPYGEPWLPNVQTTYINPGEWRRIEVYYKWETNPGVSGDGTRPD